MSQPKESTLVRRARLLISVQDAESETDHKKKRRDRHSLEGPRLEVNPHMQFKRMRLAERQHSLLEKYPNLPPVVPSEVMDSYTQPSLEDELESEEDFDSPIQDTAPEVAWGASDPSQSEVDNSRKALPRRRGPTQRALRLYANWQSFIPKLVPQMLRYDLDFTESHQTPPLGSSGIVCPSHTSSREVLCIEHLRTYI